VKRRRVFVWVFGCVAAVIIASILSPREHEPEYNRVKLSVWLERYEYGNAPAAAYPAIRHIGTNSLPFLLDWIQHETPAWKLYARRAAAKMPSLIQRNRFVRWLLADARELRANSAVAGFQVLASQAEPARADLQRLAANSSPGKKQTTRRARLSIMRMEQQPSAADYAERRFP
jgi:hypothetical protein